jgi:transcriptional regulator with XRE-family HTH domain
MDEEDSAEMSSTVHIRRVPNRRLQELRINNGLSQRDLARLTHVSNGTIRMAEAGFVPGPRIQYAIADQFGMKPLDIWPLSSQKVAV